MKKKHIIFSVCTMALALLSSASIKSDAGIIESTEVNNKALKSIDVKELNDSNTTFKTSKIYKQVDATGQYLRFATAIKGNVNSIKYTRTIDDKETNKRRDFEVSTLYKGIISGKNVAFYNGRDLFDEKITGTDDYYWACYTIKFTSETYKKSNIDVTLNIDGKDITSTSTSLYDAINYKEELPSFGEILSNNLFNLDYDVNTYDSVANACIQDAIMVGDYVYYTTTGGSGLEGSLVKAKLTDTGLVTDKTINNLKFATETGWCSSEILGNIFQLDNLIYVMVINVKTIIVDETTKIETATASYNTYDLDLNKVADNVSLPITIDGKSISSMYYNSTRKMYVTSATDNILHATTTTFSLVDINNKVAIQYDVKSSNNCKYQSMFADEDLIYLVFGANETTIAEIKVYNWNGEFVKTILLSGENMVLNPNTAVQSVSYYNDSLYIFARDWNPANSYVFKANLNNSKITFGESIDLANKKGQEQTITINKPNYIDQTSDANIQSVQVNDSYIYYGLTDGSGNKTFTVMKVSLNSNKIEKSNAISTASDDKKTYYTYQTAGNICLVNDIIYVTTIDLGLKAVDANTLEEVPCNLVFEDAPSAVINSLAFNEETNLFAVVFANSNNIYYYDMDGNFIKTTEMAINTNGLDFQTLSTSGAYLYAISGKDRTFATSIDVFDWNGNHIANKYINTNAEDYTGIKLGISTSSNVQSLIDINGKSYILVLQWNDSVANANDKGGYLYPVEL